MARQLKCGLVLALVATPALAADRVPVENRVPVQNVDYLGHPNLAAAQTLVRQAYDRFQAPEYNNDDQIGRHALRAKALLVEVNDEIRLAADEADRR